MALTNIFEIYITLLDRNIKILILTGKKMKSLFLTAILHKGDSKTLKNCFEMDKLEKELGKVDESMEAEDFLEGFTQLERILKKMIPILKHFKSC